MDLKKDARRLAKLKETLLANRANLSKDTFSIPDKVYDQSIIKYYFDAIAKLPEKDRPKLREMFKDEQARIMRAMPALKKPFLMRKSKWKALRDIHDLAYSNARKFAQVVGLQYVDYTQAENNELEEARKAIGLIEENRKKLEKDITKKHNQKSTLEWDILEDHLSRQKNSDIVLEVLRQMGSSVTRATGVNISYPHNEKDVENAIKDFNTGKKFVYEHLENLSNINSPDFSTFPLNREKVLEWLKLKGEIKLDEAKYDDTLKTKKKLEKHVEHSDLFLRDKKLKNKESSIAKKSEALLNRITKNTISEMRGLTPAKPVTIRKNRQEVAQLLSNIHTLPAAPQITMTQTNSAIKKQQLQ